MHPSVGSIRCAGPRCGQCVRKCAATVVFLRSAVTVWAVEISPNSELAPKESPGVLPLEVADSPSVSAPTMQEQVESAIAAMNAEFGGDLMAHTASLAQHVDFVYTVGEVNLFVARLATGEALQRARDDAFTNGYSGE